MRKLSLFLAIFCTLQASAQPYSISFSGTGLSTVKVQNLTSGIIVDVPAGYVLLLSTPTGIPEVNNIKSSGLKIYPNPMTDKSTLEILPPVAGDATVTVYDMTGKALTQFKGYLDNYTQEFSLSGIRNGLFIVNVQGNGYQFSEKLLSNGKSNQTVVLARVSNNIQPVGEKKSMNIPKGVMGIVEMAYNTGDRLKYTAVSGSNSTVKTEIPTTDNTVAFTFTECKDWDNNNYPVVTIGTQTWMAENLKTPKYNDGTAIPNVSVTATWISLTTGAYCDYGNNQANSTTYGKLYNWYAVDNNAATKVASNGGKNVCPVGWHVPSDAEWTTMENYLIANGNNYDGTTTGNKIAKSLAATTNWAANTIAGAPGNTDFSTYRNKTGFTALPGGYRLGDGSFYNIGAYGMWWSSTAVPTNYAWYRNVYNNYNYVYRNYTLKVSGVSVRCIKD